MAAESLIMKTATNQISGAVVMGVGMVPRNLLKNAAYWDCGGAVFI
jgi:hypothetical protein